MQEINSSIYCTSKNRFLRQKRGESQHEGGEAYAPAATADQVKGSPSNRVPCMYFLTGATLTESVKTFLSSPTR